MKKRTIFLTLILVAFLGITSAFAGMSGQPATGIQIQNLSTTNSATVTMMLYNQTGGAPVSVPISPNPITPGASANVYMPAQSVAAGTYSGVLSSDAPLGAIVRNDWNASGGAAIYSTVDPATDVTIPLVTYQYASQSSDFTVQNAGTANATDISITLYQNGQSAAVASLTNQSIAVGASKTYHLTDIQPSIAAGFVGSVKVQSATTAMVVQSFIDVSGSRGVTAFSGVPTSSASTSLFCPLARANYYGDTGISVVNPNSSAVTVTINFRGLTGTAYVQSLLVPANSSAVAFQGPGGNSRTGTTPALPWGSGQNTTNPTPTNNGFFGSAEIVSPSPVMAVVNDTLFGAGWSVRAQSSYNCLSTADGGTNIALPLVRSKHLTSLQLSTGIQIQNTGAASVTVALELYNTNGTRRNTSEPAPVVIPAHGSANLWAGSFADTAGGWVGSGILKVTSGTGPIVAMVSDEGFGSVAIDSANYTGLKMAP